MIIVTDRRSCEKAEGQKWKCGGNDMENSGKETYVEQMERVNQTNLFMLLNRIRAVALSERSEERR